MRMISVVALELCSRSVVVLFMIVFGIGGMWSNVVLHEVRGIGLKRGMLNA